MSTAISAKPGLTGRKVLLLFIGFFSIVFLVNGVMIHLALKTFPGVEDQRPYERGLNYDREIAQARAQAERLGQPARPLIRPSRRQTRSQTGPKRQSQRESLAIQAGKSRHEPVSPVFQKNPAPNSAGASFLLIIGANNE